MRIVDTYCKIRISKLVLIFITALGIFLCSGLTSYGQVKGPDRIVGEYTGDTKKDLANGPGKAKGFDSYEGNFKKGFPNGAGVYTFGSNVTIGEYNFKTGDVYSGNFVKGEFHGKGNITFADTSKIDLVGYWEDGKYVGRTEKGYDIIHKDGIDRVICHYNSSAVYSVRIYGLSDIREETPKSVEFSNGMYRDLKASNFPLLVHVSGSSPVDMSRCELMLMIEKPGEWEITLETN